MANEIRKVNFWHANCNLVNTIENKIGKTKKNKVMKKTNYILSLVLILSVILTNVLQAQDQPKKKWSPVLKGGVIGAATGAVAGAVINKKNRVAGGVVGAAVGGAAGAVVGKVIEKKQEKKAAEEQQRMEQLDQVAVASAPA